MFPLAQMMDHDWGDHGGSSWAWIVMVALMVLLVAIVVLAAVRFMLHTPAAAASQTPAPGGPSRSAQDLLADRLARGEIDVDEYRRRLDALRPD
jgi:putative membrane protein